MPNLEKMPNPRQAPWSPDLGQDKARAGGKVGRRRCCAPITKCYSSQRMAEHFALSSASRRH